MPAATLGERVKGWVSANAEHAVVRFFPDPGGAPLEGGEGYLRLWLVEGFLGKQKKWATKYFPALHGGVVLNFLGSEDTSFTKFTKQGASLAAPGAFLNYPMTSLIPFAGGTVEVEAELYQVTAGSPLDTAVTIAGGLASLIGPPLSVAATVAEKVSTGINAVLDAQKERPVLAVHQALSSAGGGGELLRPGYLAVVNDLPAAARASLHMEDGRLHGADGQLTGCDFLLLRIECQEERDDWRFPKLEQLRRSAIDAYHSERFEEFEKLKKLAIAEVFNSADFTESDAFRVAAYLRASFEKVTEFGVVPDQENSTLDPIPVHLLPDRFEVAELTLADLLRF
ncbi:hypothetical protein [Amycolatopsis sp. NPDC098790]|uniref:hypothetical protein n=1 Tax=Amycolatopsis sp. NPDC098790 TaxID=3363939 RepID=UPI0037F55884